MKTFRRTSLVATYFVCLFLTVYLYNTESKDDVVEMGIWNVSNFPYINLFIGKNRTNLKFLFDTGSTALVVKDKTCKTCKDENPFDHSTFDSASSSTLSFLTPSDTSCKSNTLCGKNCSRTFTYLDKTELNTCWVNDLVNIRLLNNNNSSRAAINNYFNFYIIKQQEGDINMDGIVGVQDFGESITNNICEMHKDNRANGNTSKFIKSLGSFGFVEYIIGSYDLKHRTMLIDIGEYKLTFGYSGHRPKNNRVTTTVANTNTQNNKKQIKGGKGSYIMDNVYRQGFIDAGVIRDRSELKKVEPQHDPRHLWYKNNSKKIAYDPKIHKLNKISNIKVNNNINTNDKNINVDNNLVNSNGKDNINNTFNRSKLGTESEEFKINLQPFDFLKYEVNINRLKFNNKDLSTIAYRSFLDTGSTNIYIPKRLYNKLIKEILGLVPGFGIFTGENSYCFPEAQVKDILDKLPKLILVLENKNQVKLTIDILVKTKSPNRDKDLYCSAISSLDQNAIIIGFPFFLKRKVLFDYNHGKILITGDKDQLNEIGDVYKNLSFIIKLATLLL